MNLEVRFQQALVLASVLLLPLLFAHSGWRCALVRRPWLPLASIVVLDLVYMTWATWPFVPFGVDECFFRINAHVYRGEPLFVMYVRPPLPGLGAALCPWHPPLPGLLLKAATTVLTYAIARPRLGVSGGLLAAWIVSWNSHLSHWSAALLSEPYGAFAVALFVWLLARGGAGSLGLAAAVAFLSRFPLGILAPLAVAVAARRRGWSGALVAMSGFALPVITVLHSTGSDPWRVFAERAESGYRGAMLDSLLALCAPPALGLGALGVPIAAWAGWRILRAGHSAAPALRWSLAVGAIGVGSLVAMGEATIRFLAPLAPTAAVLIAAGAHDLRRRWPWLARPPLAALLAGILAAQAAVPVKPPRVRERREASRGAMLAAQRSEILRVAGPGPVHTDFDFLVLTAILAIPCPAVVPEHNVHQRHHPAGVGHGYGLTAAGRLRDGAGPGPGRFRLAFFPPLRREELPAGSLYLTYDAGERPALWQGAGLSLVRW